MSESDRLGEIKVRWDAKVAELQRRGFSAAAAENTAMSVLGPWDLHWLVAEVERLREELAPCGEVGCPHAHAVPTLRAEGRSTE